MNGGSGGQEQWPNLQDFVSNDVPYSILGEAKIFAVEIRQALQNLSLQQRADIASECWDFLHSFKDRYDDQRFLRDGFGASGYLKNDDRGREQVGRHRVKMLYDAFAESLRVDG